MYVCMKDANVWRGYQEPQQQSLEYIMDLFLYEMTTKPTIILAQEIHARARARTHTHTHTHA